jgi:hypothetical protein
MKTDGDGFVSFESLSPSLWVISPNSRFATLFSDNKVSRAGNQIDHWDASAGW